MDSYGLNLMNELDAAVFSGDMLFDADTLNEFEIYVGRWQRAIKSQRDLNELIKLENSIDEE